MDVAGIVITELMVEVDDGSVTDGDDNDDEDDDGLDA